MTKPSKNAVETTKTVVIAVLVTAIVAFVGGMHYQAQNTARTQNAIKQAVASKN